MDPNYREELIWSADIDKTLSDHEENLLNLMSKKLRSYLLNGPVLVEGNSMYGNNAELSERNIDFYFDEFRNNGILERFILGALDCHGNLNRYLALKVCDYTLHMDRRRMGKKGIKELTYRMQQTDWDERIMKEMRGRFSRRKVLQYLEQNPLYRDLVRTYETNRQKRASLHANMLKEIPDNYVDFYPLARQMDRHFIIHEGPTNSGKTYQAIQALKASGKGIYLGPLRLLAYEQFESLNMDGYPCSLVTGEERMEVPGSRYQASTVEMFNPEAYYEVAVIDEAQMISDDSRGGGWTAAILGLCADEIHICCASHAVPLLKRLIEDCGDDYEVMHHKRQTPLKMETRNFTFPKSVEDKDALIVFSKRDVHAVASELQRKGISCSVIYGSLPYDVRHDEARRFVNGETQVVVATDAIGMGLNLPIRRIVFLADAKFDGKDIRPLYPEEVQQIAGRAGRRGIFDVGFVNAFGDRSFIESCLNTKVEELDTAVISFPESLLGLDAPLSAILKRWNAISDKPGYVKEDLDIQIKLCEQLEMISGPKDKALIYQFLMIPFDEGEDLLNRLWVDYFRAELYGYEIPFADVKPKLETFHDPDASDLPELELSYKICDLTFYYDQRFGHTDDFAEIADTKRQISEMIMKILEKQKLPAKVCAYCGRPLPWNYRYTMCENCHRRRRWR